MIDHHNAYRHGLAADQRLRHAPPTRSTKGWDFEPSAPRRAREPLWLVALVGLLPFAIGFGLWVML